MTADLDAAIFRVVESFPGPLTANAIIRELRGRGCGGQRFDVLRSLSRLASAQQIINTSRGYVVPATGPEPPQVARSAHPGPTTGELQPLALSADDWAAFYIGLRSGGAR